MITCFNNGQVQGGGSTQQSNDPGNDLTRLSMGPAALIQKLIYEIMALYAEIITLDSKQKQLMVQAQKTEAQGQAKATIAGGEAAKEAAIAAGVMTFVGAVASIMVFSKVAKSLQPKDPELANAEGNLKNMSKVQDAMKLEGADAVGGGAPANLDEATNTRIQEFNNGDYRNALEDEATTRKAVKSMKADEANYEKWKEEFNKEQLRNTTAQNTFSQERLQASNAASVWSPAVKALGDGGAQFAQGVGQAKKATHDAAAGLNSTASQMSGSSQGEWGQAMSKAYDAQNAEVQILERVNQTNSVNG